MKKSKRDFLHRGKEYSQRKGVMPSLFRGFLKGVSFFWGIGSFLRNFCYDHKILPVKRVPSFVVSVGNLVAGGTGKTPFTLLLAEQLIRKGVSLAILSRGYGSRIEKENKEKILSLEESWEEVGDEPLLFKERLQERADVIVGKDRFSIAQMAEKKDRRVLLLDDGMQARSLHRDLEITLLNGQDLFGQNAFLPSGYLRESKKGLQRSDFVIVNHLLNKEHFTQVKEKIQRLTKAPVVGVCPRFSSVKDLNGKKKEIKNATVALFCAIAKPHLFCDLVKKEKFQIVDQLFLHDHGAVSEEELASFAEHAKAKGAEAILCTEKDKSKLSFERQLPLPIYYMEMELEVVEGKEIFETLLEKICNGSTISL